MAMREPKTDQQIELMGSCSKTVLSGPDLSDHFPLLSFDLLTHSSPGVDVRCIALIPAILCFGPLDQRRAILSNWGGW